MQQKKCRARGKKTPISLETGTWFGKSQFAEKLKKYF